MKKESSGDARLSGIQTFWTVLSTTHGGASDPTAAAAAQQLLLRYTKAVHRYLLGALRDADAADELAQEFALRFMRGDLHRADPAKGRFRDFVKGVLFHLIADHHRKQKRNMPALPDSSVEDTRAADPCESDREFLESWRAELLDRAWKALQKLQEETGQLFYAVLHFRAEHPDMRSAEMSGRLSEQLGKPVNAAWVRQMLHRAREKFADLLLEETLQTLREPTVDQLEAELIDVGLLEYCKPALDKLRAAE
jgi:RNA polymerase sigma-70 factor (ECF subfamily)